MHILFLLINPYSRNPYSQVASKLKRHVFLASQLGVEASDVSGVPSSRGNTGGGGGGGSFYPLTCCSHRHRKGMFGEMEDFRQD